MSHKSSDQTSRTSECESHDSFKLRLGELQREMRNRGVPVILVFEGMSAAGKGTAINELLLCLDPRGFSVFPIKPAGPEESLYPFLARFWLCTPERGRIAIFDRSWYRELLDCSVKKDAYIKRWSRQCREILAFERQLVDDGAIILKFFLHIGKKEQKKRFDKLLRHKATAWRVTESDWEQHRRYRRFSGRAEDVIGATSCAGAPWIRVDAHDRDCARVAVFSRVIAALEARIGSPPIRQDRKPRDRGIRLPANRSMLGDVDLSVTLDRQEYDAELGVCRKKIRELGYRVYEKRLPVAIVFEGWDAAGKGGAIRRLAGALDPRGYEVIPVAAPNDEEKRHHYLWRFWRKVPRAGHLAIFDRSWYGRVLVERVEGFCTREEWTRAYAEINEMERQWSDSDTVIVKLWLHIDKQEQLRRFKAREEVSHKQWKITEEDWRNREKWDQYHAAVEDMLVMTTTPHAPWTVIAADCKLHARISALQTIITAVEQGLRCGNKPT